MTVWTVNLKINRSLFQLPSLVVFDIKMISFELFFFNIIVDLTGNNCKNTVYNQHSVSWLKPVIDQSVHEVRVSSGVTVCLPPSPLLQGEEDWPGGEEKRWEQRRDGLDQHLQPHRQRQRKIHPGDVSWSGDPQETPGPEWTGWVWGGVWMDI